MGCSYVFFNKMQYVGSLLKKMKILDPVGLISKKNQNFKLFASHEFDF